MSGGSAGRSSCSRSVRGSVTWYTNKTSQAHLINIIITIHISFWCICVICRRIYPGHLCCGCVRGCGTEILGSSSFSVTGGRTFLISGPFPPVTFTTLSLRGVGGHCFFGSSSSGAGATRLRFCCGKETLWLNHAKTHSSAKGAALYVKHTYLRPPASLLSLFLGLSGFVHPGERNDQREVKLSWIK